MGSLATKFVEDVAPGILTSTKALLEKYPVGKIWSEYLEHTYAPAVDSIAQSKMAGKISSGMAHDVAYNEAHIEAMREARKQFIGPNDEALIKVIHTARQQHGVPYANMVADSMGTYFRDQGQYWRTRSVRVTPGQNPINLKKSGISSTPNYKAPQELEHNIKDAMGWMLTPLIAIPHTSQVANIVFDTSVKDVVRGLGEYFSSGPTKRQFQDDLLKSGALFDELRFQAIEDAKGGGLARKMFHHPAFGFIRRQEISIAAAAGKSAAMDKAAVLARDPSNTWANHTLAKLGINPQDVIRQNGVLTPEQIQKAMYAEANRSIFLRTGQGMYTPWKFQENFWGRLNFQYKDFIYRQTKFIVDGFKNAYKYGGMREVMKTAGVWGTLFPAMGELVHSMEQIATAQNPLKRDTDNPGSEFFDALGYSAGYGIFYSMWRAGSFNGGRGALEGPVFNTVEDLTFGVGSDLMHHDKEGNYDPRIKSALRRISSKGGIPGKIINKAMQADKP